MYLLIDGFALMNLAPKKCRTQHLPLNILQTFFFSMSLSIKSALTEYGVKVGFFKPEVKESAPMGSDKTLSPPSVAPPAPPAISGSSPLFHIGQRVEAKPEGKSKWFGATVMHVNNGGESFKIKYDSAMWNAWMPVNDPKVLASCSPSFFTLFFFSFLHPFSSHNNGFLETFSRCSFCVCLETRLTLTTFGAMLAKEILHLLTTGSPLLAILYHTNHAQKNKFIYDDDLRNIYIYIRIYIL
jgi:hypothetical protein